MVVAKSGKMYLSDASPVCAQRLGRGRLKPAFWTFWSRHQPAVFWNTTRQTKRPESSAKGLSFANGVALSQDEQTLFVNETGKYRVWKISGAKDLDVSTPSGQAKVLFDNLPGYPDNLMRGLDGKIWLGFAKPRNPTIDKMAAKPFMRKLTLRLPRVRCGRFQKPTAT